MEYVLKAVLVLLNVYGVLPASLSMYHVCSSQGGQRRSLGPLELDWQESVGWELNPGPVHEQCGPNVKSEIFWEALPYPRGVTNKDFALKDEVLMNSCLEFDSQRNCSPRWWPSRNARARVIDWISGYTASMPWQPLLQLGKSHGGAHL